MQNGVSIAVGLVLAGVIATLAYRSTADRPAAPPSVASEPPTAPPALLTARAFEPRDPGYSTDRAVPQPLHTRSRYPRLARIPVESLPAVERGIPTPDGHVLPPLNGMTQVPMIERDPKFGPTPPVIELWVDWDGFEWWIHADGSATTSRYAEVKLGDGRQYWDPVSIHLAPRDAASYRKVGAGK